MNCVKLKNGVIIGSIGACFMAIGDWLIGYIDPTPMGGFMVLVRGCNEVGCVRPVLSMAAALIGVIMSTYGLMCMTETITKESKLKKLYKQSVICGSVQWLFIHFVFCGFRYIYHYLWNEGYDKLAYETVYSVCDAFMPIIYISIILVTIPFGVYFVALLKKDTIFPRWAAIFYMLTFTVIFNIIAKILGNTSVANGFSTAANNMAIAIWLFATWIYLRKSKKTTINI